MGSSRQGYWSGVPLISFRIDWFDLLTVQGTLKSLLQHHSSKASILWHSAFFVVQHSHPYMLLLLLSRFSHVRLCATPLTAAHQAPPSLGFSRQEHWSGLPFPSPMQGSESEVVQYQTLRDSMDCSLPGSFVHGIFQARVLEWGAIALLTMPKPLTVWITTNCGKFFKRWEYQTTIPAS